MILFTKKVSKVNLKILTINVDLFHGRQTYFDVCTFLMESYMRVESMPRQTKQIPKDDMQSNHRCMVFYSNWSQSCTDSCTRIRRLGHSLNWIDRVADIPSLTITSDIMKPVFRFDKGFEILNPESSNWCSGPLAHRDIYYTTAP